MKIINFDIQVESRQQAYENVLSFFCYQIRKSMSNNANYRLPKTRPGF